MVQMKMGLFCAKDKKITLRVMFLMPCQTLPVLYLIEYLILKFKENQILNIPNSSSGLGPRIPMNKLNKTLACVHSLFSKGSIFWYVVKLIQDLFQ